MRPILWLAGILFVTPAAAAANSPAIVLTVDCPACGRGQPIPHDCPRGAAAPVLAAPDPLPALLESTRALHRRFSTLENFALPELGAPRSLAELDRTLTSLLTAARAAVARAEREQEGLLRGVASAAAEAQRLATRVAELTAASAHARDQLTALPPQINAAHSAAVAARDEFLAWQKTNAALREQIRQARNRLFPRLHQAAQRGWILPPSSYREFPSPLPPKSVGSSPDRLSIAQQLFPEQRYSLDLNGPAQRIATPTGVSISSGRHSFDTGAAEAEIRTKLNELSAVHYNAYAAVATRAEAQGAGSAAQDNTAALSTKLATLEPAHAALAVQLIERASRLAETRQVAATEIARAREQRQRTLATWIETGVYRFLDRQAEVALAPLLVPGATAAHLRAFRLIAETAAQLGAAPDATLARLPAALAARGETLTDIQRELSALRTAPELTFTATRADLPAALQAYWPETRP